MRIVVDAGHGGYDPGAIGPTGVKEAHINLVVARHLANLLISAGAEVLLTRDSDAVPWPANTYEDLGARVKMANDWGADFFISVHCNSAANPTARGVETYCYKYGGQGAIAAQAIQDELLSGTGLFDRGVKEGNFEVIRETAAPGVLVEMGFISNVTEEKLLTQPTFQDKLAASIFTGIAKVYGLKPLDDGGVKIIVGKRVMAGVIINDSTYAPVRALAEALGRKVEWDAKTRTVTII